MGDLLAFILNRWHSNLRLHDNDDEVNKTMEHNFRRKKCFFFINEWMFLIWRKIKRRKMNDYIFRVDDVVIKWKFINKRFQSIHVGWIEKKLNIQEALTNGTWHAQALSSMSLSLTMAIKMTANNVNCLYESMNIFSSL